MCNDLLSNVTCYETLSRDPTELYQNKLKLILQEAKSNKLISSNEFDFLYPLHPRVATFYSLSELHKGTSPLKGRPIISGVDSLTQNSVVYFNRILRPFVQALHSYTRDTTDLIQRLNGVTIDDVPAWMLRHCIPLSSIH